MKRTENALLLRLPNHEQGVSEIFQHSQYAFVILESCGSIKWYNNKANQVFIRIYGVEVLTSALIRNSFFETAENLLCVADRVQGGIVIEEEKEFLCSDGSTLWLEISVSSGNGSGDILLSFHDITQRKTVIKSLKQYDSILSAISFASEMFLNSTDLEKSIYAVLNKLGIATGVNRIQIFENHAEDDPNLKLDVLFEWSDGNTEIEKENTKLRGLSYKSLGLGRWEEILSEGEVIEGIPDEFEKAEREFLLLEGSEYVVITPVLAGKKFWGIIKYDSFYSSKRLTPTEIDALYSAGQIFGAAIQRINFERELIIARDAAEKSNRLKTEFLAQMSHEIRTPINSILCFTSLLENELSDKIPDELKSCFETIDSGGRRLIRTIDMILNMSQFQSDSYEANYQEIDLARGFFEKIIEEFKPIAQAKGLKLNIIKNTSESEVLADPYTLEQIFINLIDNSIKFTHRGEISIIIYKGINCEVCVDISDPGVGISEEYLPNLFTPFTQEEMGYTRKFEGNGLGLALVKKYLEINSASILVESKKNSGSTFTVIFRKSNS